MAATTERGVDSNNPHRLIAVELDPSIYNPAPEALDFLHATITPNDAELKKIVLDVQQKAYAIHPFPCIFRFAFLMLRMWEHDKYSEIIQAGKQDPNAILLDIGCCMGTDLRKAVYDGFPATRLVGADIFPAFFDMGHKLWNDKETCGIKFIYGDVFDLPDTEIVRPEFDNTSSNIKDNSEIEKLNDLAGQVKYIYLGSVFHLFGDAQQAEMARKLAILASRKPGTILFGAHMGASKKGLHYDQWMESKQMFCHSPESWKDLWIDSFSRLAGEDFAKQHVKVQAELMPLKGDRTASDPDSAKLTWSVSIV